MVMVIPIIHIMTMVTLVTEVLITILMNIIHHTGEEKGQAVCHQTIMMIWEQEVPAGEPVMVLPAVILLQGEEHHQPARLPCLIPGELPQESHRAVLSNLVRMLLKVKVPQ
jgi:hypothetical protein